MAAFGPKFKNQKTNFLIHFLLIINNVMFMKLKKMLE